MRKMIALLLAVLFIASAITSCASTQTATAGAKVRTTSSDAASAAEWLEARLGDKLTANVVIGTDSDGYNVDVSALEDDGYVIRSIGDEVAIFARTSVGLDRAARKYAKAVEAGETALLDESFHEGARIEKLTIAGNDISGYAITVEGEWDFLCRWVTEHVAGALSKLLLQATGVNVPVGGEAAHKIVLRGVKDESFKESSYHYYVKDGDLVIEYADTTGAKNGIVMFLEDQLGWESLMWGRDFLNESDRIDVPADLDVRVDPLFDYMRMYSSSYRYDLSSLWAADSKIYNDSGRVPECCHGLLHGWGVPPQWWGQICYTDEATRTTIENTVMDYLDEQEEIGNHVGEEISYIDLGQSDFFGYCHCKNCVTVYGEEGGAISGAVVRWANRVDETFRSEGYENLKILVFAYHGTNIPCITRPNDNVYVTLCYDGSCYRHLLDGSQCKGSSFDMAGYWGADVRLNNNDYYAWTRGWCDLSDNIYIWYYTLYNNFHCYSSLHLIYDDFRLMSECGVKGLFWQAEAYEFGISAVQTEVGMELSCRPDMTREEYRDRLIRELELEYGDGWAELMEIIDIWTEAILRVEECGNCWGYMPVEGYDNNDVGFFMENYDHIMELFDSALTKVKSAKQETDLKRFASYFIYHSCFCEYFPAYEAGDTEKIEELRTRYAKFVEWAGDARERGSWGNTENWEDHENKVWCQSSFVYKDLEQTAWNLWVSERSKFFPAGTELKPVPQEYVVVE